jgi:hypothetical protein
MIYLVIVCCAIIIPSLVWFLYSRNFELLLCFLLVLNFEVFYLLPQFKDTGGHLYKLFVIPILLVILSYELIMKRISLGRYGWWILLFLLQAAVGIIVGYLYGQPIELGLKAAVFTILITVYFVSANHKIDESRFIKYFIVLALAAALISTIQYIYYGNIYFLLGKPEELIVERMGRVRINVGSALIFAATVISFARFRQTSNKLYIVATMLLFLEICFIQQTRAYIAGSLLGVALVFLLSKKTSPLKILIYLLGSIIFVITTIGYIEDLELIQYTLEEGGGVRIYTYAYYWNELENHFFFGMGIRNFLWSGNEESLLQEYGLHLSDVGIFRFFVQAGFTGCILFCAGMVLMWKDIVKFRASLHLSAYIIVASIVLPTIDMFFHENAMFVFALFLGLFSFYIQESLIKSKEEKV